ncbi:MMK1, partial [Symbiodinium pilosum]
MASLRSDKWDFLQDDAQVQEDTLLEASELREKANALTHHAQAEDMETRQQHLHEALAMYRRADALLKGRIQEPQIASMVLQIRLNAACLAVQIAEQASHSVDRQQAEQCATGFAHAALEIDPENPHAALILARLSVGRQNSQAEQFLQKAQMWSLKRHDEDVLRQAQELAKRLTQGDSPTLLVRKGAELFKQGKLLEAERLLTQAIDYLDRKEHGGPIEVLAAQPLRALAFDALEVKAECLAAGGDFAASLKCGGQAAGLLEAKAPFAEPERSRREGLLYLSLGHAAEAARDKDALSFFRRAAQALQRSDASPSVEGRALLEFGLRLVQEFDNGDQEAADLAMPTLERALDKLKLAHGQLLKSKPAGQDASLQKQNAVASERLLSRQLQAQVALCSLHLAQRDKAAAEEVLNASQHLLRVVEDCESPLQWAALCGRWAFAAAQVGRFREAEDALRLKWNLAGGKDPEWGQSRSDLPDQPSSPEEAERLRLQQE